MPTADRRTSSNLSSGTALPKRPFCIALGRTNAKRLQNIKVRPPLTGTDFGGDRPNLAHYMHPGALVHGVARPCAPPPPARQRKSRPDVKQFLLEVVDAPLEGGPGSRVPGEEFAAVMHLQLGLRPADLLPEQLRPVLP